MGVQISSIPLPMIIALLTVVQLMEKSEKLFNADKEAQEKVLEEFYEKLRILEDGIKEFYPEGTPGIHAEQLGILDIMLLTSLDVSKTAEEVTGVKTIDPERNPLISSWVEALIQLPFVKETIPPREKFVALLQFLKENGLRSLLN